MGDFNLEAVPDQKAFNGLIYHPSRFQPLIHSEWNKTTIGTSGKLTSGYDNILISLVYTSKEWNRKPGKTADFTGFYTDIKKTRIQISDHIPVYADFYTNIQTGE